MQTQYLNLKCLVLLLLLDLQQQSAVDVGKDTSEGDGCADEGIEFFVSTDGELKVARGDTLDFEILCGISCKLEDFSGEIFENGGNVDCSLGTNAHLILGVVLQETLDTTAGELKTSLARMALLLLSTVGSDLASGRLPAR